MDVSDYTRRFDIEKSCLIKHIWSSHLTLNSTTKHSSNTTMFDVALQVSACCQSTAGCLNAQVEVAETAEATAQAAHAMTQLSVLLPSQGLLFGKAACHAVCQGASVKAAGQQGGVWSGADAASPAQARSPTAINPSIQSVSPHSLTQLSTH